MEVIDFDISVYENSIVRGNIGNMLFEISTVNFIDCFFGGRVSDHRNKLFKIRVRPLVRGKQ